MWTDVTELDVYVVNRLDPYLNTGYFVTLLRLSIPS